MANFLTNLGKKLLRFVKDSSKLKSLTKDDFVQLLELNIGAHDAVVSSFGQLKPTELTNAYMRYDRDRGLIKSKAKDVPVNLRSKYRGGAKRIEDSKPWGAFIEANRQLLKIQQDILKNLDKIIVDKEVTVLNTRVATVTLLGLLRQSELYAKYSSFLVDLISRSLANPKDEGPRYRAAYMLEHFDEFVEITNLVCDKSGRYSFLNEVDNLKKRNANTLLYANGQTFDVMAKASMYTKSVQSYLASSFHFLNVFLWAGEIIQSYYHERYLSNKSTKDWLESHVAYLRLQLSDVDPDSKEAMRLNNIIDAYDDQIAKYDRQINEYLEDD